MTEKTEELNYSCTCCSSPVSAEDIICNNCGADLREEVHPVKFIKTGHRVTYYLLLHPFIVIISGFILGLLPAFLSGSSGLSDSYYFNSGKTGLIILVLPVLLTSFIFSFIFIEREKKMRTLTAVMIAAITFGSAAFISSDQSVLLILTLAFIISGEAAFIFFSRKDFRILIPAFIISVICYLVFRSGDLQNEDSAKGFDQMIQKEKIYFTDIISSEKLTDPGYDTSLKYRLLTMEGAVTIIMNYNKIYNTLLLSPEWKLVNWTKFESL